MTDRPSLKTIETVLLILTIMLNNIILNIPKKMIDLVGTGTFINVLFIGTIAVVFTYVLTLLFKNFEGQDILDISKFLGGSFLRTMVGIAFIAVFLFFVILGIVHYTILLKTIYFPTSPIIYLVLFFVIGIYVANRYGSKSVIKTTLIIVPVTIISLVILFASVSPYYVPERLSPVLGFGEKKIFLSGISNIFAFNGIIFLYFIGPFLEKKSHFKKISILSTILSWVFLILAVVALLALFPFISYAKDFNSIYIIARLVKYGNFFQRTDAIFIFVWITSLFLYLSVFTLMILEIFKKIVGTKDERGMNLFFVNLILAFIILLNQFNAMQYLEQTIFQQIISIFIFMICPIILIFANIKKKFQKKTALQKNINRI